MQTRVTTIPEYKHLFIGLCLVSFLSMGLYVYGVTSTVHNAVALQAIRTQVSAINLQSGEAEFAYIAEANSVDLAKATAMGFAPVDATTFVSRTPRVAYAVSVERN